jgi:flagellar hook protein FlgE
MKQHKENTNEKTTDLANERIHETEKETSKRKTDKTTEEDEEELYFVSSDDDENESTMKTEEEEDRTDEETIITNEDKEETKTTTKKKMKVTSENLPFGHACDDIAADNDTPYVRVYCQNVCGVFDREGIGLESAFKEIKQAGADIFTFNETHGDESNAVARRALRIAKQRMWRDNNEDCKIVHSSSTAPVINFTKPGGNMVGITGSLVGRIRDTITDPYGRWCGYTLIGRDTKEILVLTAYNVSQYKNAKVGDDTLFNQQVALYKLNNIRDPDPKEIFINDLTLLIQKARKEDKDIILTGDFNELVGDDPRGMAKVLAAGNLTDAHDHQHGTVEISTYTRGTKRLDYVFVTPRLVDHILRSGYESFHARIASDHRGYFVDFALAGFLDRQLPAIFSASSRAIRGTHPSNITKYVEYLDEYLEERDIYRKVKEQKHWYNKEKLEKLDRIITMGMLEAEDQCRIHHRQPWSKEVNEVMTTANILRINLSSLKNNIDCSKQIAQKQSLLKNEIKVPKDLEQATIALRKAQKECRKLIKEQRTKKTSIDEEQEAAFVAMNPEMDAKRAAQIFQRAKDTKQMMSELPSKMNCPGGISSVLVPLPKEGEELEYLAITDGPTIENLILNRNIRHFRQAESTPLASPEVIRQIGFGADTARAEKLLEGTDDPTDITDDEWSRYLLTSMKSNRR